MGASRKLQGEIDRVLKKVQEGVDIFDSIWNKVYDTENANQKEKFEADLKKEIKKLQRYRDQIKTWIQSSEIKDKKVSASYEQALLDARKQIEREMERFKVCEKETKTKAFSKEGLGQQPKTDPKEKAKAETRDWLNNVVSELESQIDAFEAEVEGLSVKKGKQRPPRLIHLETSIARHKAHIMKLELILRLLDNDELSPEQVNDVKDFLDDYVERNQEDFDEFSDVDDLYSSLPLDKVESLEDLVAIGPPALVKGVTSGAGAVIGLKSSVATSPSHVPSSQGTALDQSEETASQDSNSDIPPRTPPSIKNGSLSSSISLSTSGIGSGTPTGTSTDTGLGNISSRTMVGGPSASSILSGSGYARGAVENSTSLSTSPVNPSSSVKEDEGANFPGRGPSPALTEIGVSSLGRGSMVGAVSSQASSVPLNLSSGTGIASNGALGSGPTISDMAKRNVLGLDERMQPLVSPLSSRMLLQQSSKATDGTPSTDSSSVGDSAVIGGRVFTPSVVSGVQWRPHTANSFQNQNEMGQFRGRTEIAPDQREKFLQRLQQVQQQGHSTLLGVPHLSGANHKQFSTQQSNPLLQQVISQMQSALQKFNTQTTSLAPQVGIGLGVQSPGSLSAVNSSLAQQNVMHQQTVISSGPKDADVGHVKLDDQQQQQNISDDINVELPSNSGLSKPLPVDDDLKTPYAVDSSAGGSNAFADAVQVPRDTELSPGQPFQSSQSSANLGVIGRRSASDLGAIGDNLSSSTITSVGMHDHLFNLQMLESAFYKLPQPKDSERPRNYIPRHPAVTPASYPQVPAPIVDTPAFWERIGGDGYTNGTDTLFFAFYYQQNTYQQYLAARELKKQSWRYHRKYNTWFQRHEEPKVTTDEYEQGTYVYFDFYIANDEVQNGWCQRIKTEFTFEYCHLEDELVV